MSNMISEALLYRKYQPGQVKFSKSDINTPHIKKIVAAIAAHTGKTPDDINAYIEQKSAELKEKFAAAPILVQTIVDNLAENELFNILWKKVDLPTGAPKFSKATFFKLTRIIQGEVDQFFPLKSFIDKRRLQPNYIFIDDANHELSTAAASPNGDFYFNIPFCQKLMDFAHLKGVHPKGKKYVSNGGDIPDEYCYIEFVIMHEFLHYTEDDFYYGRIIPNSIPKIINWVGDFRSNYLLVKSGYEQLPMGLFNDNINYDRQKTYIEMYNLVKSELEKLPPGDQEGISGELDSRSDNHKPGNKAAKEQEGTPTDPLKDKNVKPQDIDNKAKETEQQVAAGKDQAPDERQAPSDPGKGQGKGDAAGAGKNPRGGPVDYDKIRPTFDWAQLVRRFLNTVSKKTVETYSKPARRGVAGTEMVTSMGAGAIKPAEIRDMSDAKLLFCFDSSGSMGHVIGMVYANAVALLKQPPFKNTECIVLRYSLGHDIFRVNFARNAGVKVTDVKAKSKKYDKTAQSVFSEHIGSGTAFTAAIAEQLTQAIKDKWNVLIFLDSDNLVGTNATHFFSVIRAAPAQVFVIFDSRNTYIQFRQQFGGSTPNITYFA